MPGPAPKPTAIKRLTGNPGKQKIATETEPQPGKTVPAIPRGIPGGARKFWQAHADKLERMGVFTEVDGPAFAMMAIHYDIAWQAAKILAEQGLQAEDENGAMRKHPMLQILRDNSAAFRSYAAEFGLTPSSRSRIKLPEPPAVDEYEAFLNG